MCRATGAARKPALTVEDWAEIRRLHKSEKLSQAEIARLLSLSRNTVAKALRSQAPPRYERAPVTTSAWAAVESAVRLLLMQSEVARLGAGRAVDAGWVPVNVATPTDFVRLAGP
jgi:IS30 family transposase